MKFISVIVLICLGIFVESIPPPLWSERFSQDFIQGDSKTKIYTSGRMYYDVGNNRQRCDTKSSYFDFLCSSVGQVSNTSCSQIIMNNNLYIWLPDLNKCCKCCTADQGCKITQRDWLKEYEFAGESVLNGQGFYKWTKYDMPNNISYYATQDAKNIPRRSEFGTYGIDFIMNTYSQQPINQNIFKIPSQCEKDCPKTSFCANFRQKSLISKQNGLYKMNIIEQKLKTQLTKKLLMF